MKQHHYLSAMTGLALVLAIAVAPSASFAAGNYYYGQEKRGAFASFASWFNFGAKTAHAETPANRAPSISGVTAPTVLTAGAEGTWTVNASDPENGSLSYSVDWGDTMAARMMAMIASPSFTQTSTFTHTYDAPGTYTIKFTAKDDQGRTSSSSVTVRVVAGTPAISVSDVASKGITQNRAIISWKSNIRGDSTVFYGTASPVDISSAASVNEHVNALNHQVALTKLTAGTTYYFVVQSKDASGGTAVSAEGSFTTASAPSKAPSITSVSGPETLKADTEGTWTVNASDPENKSLSYSVDWGETSMMRMMTASEPAFTQTSTFSHTYAAAGTYTITFTVKDDAGLTATSKTTVVVTAADATAPKISGITALVGSDRITLNWSTDESSDAAVYYSASSPVVIGGTGTTALTDGSFRTSHSLSATGLSAGTTYYFLIQSKDAEGNAAATSQFSLTTTGM